VEKTGFFSKINAGFVLFFMVFHGFYGFFVILSNPENLE